MSFLAELQRFSTVDDFGRRTQRFREIRTVPREEIKWNGRGQSFDHFLFDLSVRGEKIQGWSKRVFYASAYDVVQGHIAEGLYILKS